MLLLQAIESTSADSSSSQGASPLGPWDNTFNMALNLAKGKTDKTKKPSAGRIAGYGLTRKMGEFYNESKETKRERRKFLEEQERNKARDRDVAELKASVGTMKQDLQDELAHMVASMMPALIAMIDEWHAGGRQGPCPMPSMQGSNSRCTSRVSPANAMVANVHATLPANIAAPDVSVAPPSNSAPRAPAKSLPLMITSTPAAVIGGPSPLAEVDAIAIKVTKRRSLDIILFALDWHL